MKKILLACVAVAALCGAPAFAADMPVKAPDVAAAQPMSWTGCYVGGNIGAGRDHNDLTFSDDGDPAGKPTGTGLLGGGQIGCDYQAGLWVMGVQGMFDWGNIKKSVSDPSGGPSVTTHTVLKSFDTATARLGYALGQSLIYVDGGVAWVREGRFFVFPPALPELTTGRSGWTVGAGLEYMVAPNWSWKVEYAHADFGTTRNLAVLAGPLNAKQTVDTVLFGINYRFGAWGKTPVVAKY
jgi:outer membrane immunogenic protein